MLLPYYRTLALFDISIYICDRCVMRAMQSPLCASGLVSVACRPDAITGITVVECQMQQGKGSTHAGRSTYWPAGAKC